MIKSFKPIADENCTMLILGSMPGVKSLEENQYYAHPRNQFWRIIYALFNHEYEEDYNRRTEFLLEHHIALWDVIESCHREGSLDSAIENEQVNDFKDFFNKYTNIKVVMFNGDKAYKTFKKLVGFQFEGVEYYKLPSTSPAHAVTFHNKLEKWQILKVYQQKQSKSIVI